MNKFIALIMVAISIVFSGCVTKPFANVTKQELFKDLYDNHPKSILVLPARNTTTASNAADYFRYTISQPLAERGYYVFPVHLVDSFLKSENLSDSELVNNIPIKKFKEIFNADSVLYVDILSWDTKYSAFYSSVDVAYDLRLIETKNEKLIWESKIFGHSGTQPSANGGLSGLLIAAIASAMNSATVDYVDLASKANQEGLNNLPSGIYHETYKKDQNTMVDFIDKDYHPIEMKYPKVDGNNLIVHQIFIKFDKNMLTGSKLVDQGNMKLNPFHIKRSYGSAGLASSYYHSDFEDYYYTTHDKKRRHKFFFYDNNKPFLVIGKQKIFVQQQADGTILYKETSNCFWDATFDGRCPYTISIESKEDLSHSL